MDDPFSYAGAQDLNSVIEHEFEIDLSSDVESDSSSDEELLSGKKRTRKAKPKAKPKKRARKEPTQKNKEEMPNPTLSPNSSPITESSITLLSDDEDLEQQLNNLKSSTPVKSAFPSRTTYNPYK